MSGKPGLWAGCKSSMAWMSLEGWRRGAIDDAPCNAGLSSNELWVLGFGLRRVCRRVALLSFSCCRDEQARPCAPGQEGTGSLRFLRKARWGPFQFWRDAGGGAWAVPDGEGGKKGPGGKAALGLSGSGPGRPDWAGPPSPPPARARREGTRKKLAAHCEFFPEGGKCLRISPGGFRRSYQEGLLR